MIPDESIEPSWKDSIFRQREELARMLREPLALLARKCIPVWNNRDRLNEVLLEGFSSIPYCTYLYVVDTHGVQVSDHISHAGLIPEHYHLNRAERPYMKEAMPAWGFLLSDAYVNLEEHWPSLTALQVVVSDAGTLGHLGADFDLRRLPVTSALYQEPGNWRQVKGDPAIRSTLFQQTRTSAWYTRRDRIRPMPQYHGTTSPGFWAACSRCAWSIRLSTCARPPSTFSTEW